MTRAMLGYTHVDAALVPINCLPLLLRFTTRFTARPIIDRFPPNQEVQGKRAGAIILIMRAALLASTAARRGFASTSTSTAAAGAAAGAAWQQQQQQQTASSGSLRGSLRLRLGSSSGSAQGTRTVYVWGRPAASSSLGYVRLHYMCMDALFVQTTMTRQLMPPPVPHIARGVGLRRRRRRQEGQGAAAARTPTRTSSSCSRTWGCVIVFLCMCVCALLVV